MRQLRRKDCCRIKEILKQANAKGVITCPACGNRIYFNYFKEEDAVK